MFRALQTYVHDCTIIHRFTGGNAKCDVGLCHFTVGDNV